MYKLYVCYLKGFFCFCFLKQVQWISLCHFLPHTSDNEVSFNLYLCKSFQFFLYTSEILRIEFISIYFHKNVKLNGVRTLRFLQSTSQKTNQSHSFPVRHLTLIELWNIEVTKFPAVAEKTKQSK